MNGQDELSLEEILALQAEPEPESTRTPRKKKDPTEDRSVTNWFKLPHVPDRNCEVSDHNEERPRNKGMTVIVHDVAVCRVCFLRGTDLGAE